MKKHLMIVSLLAVFFFAGGCKKDEIELADTTWQFTASPQEMNVYDKMTLFFKDGKNFTATIGYFDNDYTETTNGIYTYAHPIIQLKFSEENIEEKLTVVDKNTLAGTLQITGQKIIFKKQ